MSANGLQVVLCDGRCCCYCSTHVSFATFYAKSGRHFFSSTLSSFDHFDASFPVDLWTSVTVSRRRFMTATIGRVSDKTVSDGRTSSHAFCVSSERKQTSAAVCLSVPRTTHRRAAPRFSSSRRRLCLRSGVRCGRRRCPRLISQPAAAAASVPCDDVTQQLRIPIYTRACAPS